MARTLTIRIKPTEQVLRDFGTTFKAIVAKRSVRSKEGVYFTSIEAARNLLTPNRLALVRAIRKERPRSIYALAKAVGRDMKNVQDDLRILEEYGLVRLAASRGRGKRRTRTPEALFDEIMLKIAI